MAANTVTDLATVANLLAETKAWGYAEWTVVGLNTAGATTATLAAATTSANTAMPIQHYLDHLTVSASGAITTAAAVQIKDGSTVIWECQWGVGGPLMMDFNFEKRPIPNTAGNLISAGVSGSLGNGVVIEVTMVGHSALPFPAA